MNKNYPRILLAAPSSGSGKTTAVCGLLQALVDRGNSCVSFKCGPDYIDPMFHKYVLGIQGGNLDSYFLEEEKVRRQFAAMADPEGISVIEGVMGYYDGLAGTSTEASSYDIARITKTPVILVVNAKGASVSLAALIKGFLDYRPDSLIKGVILNRTTKEMARRLTPVIEALGVKVAGYIEESSAMKLKSRHLGLVMPEEYEGLREEMKMLAAELEESLDIGLILEIASSAPPLETEEGENGYERRYPVRIGVARDEAFCFYYQENLKLLEDMGAELVNFSPLHGETLPDGLCGLLLGGGYPELYAKELSENRKMRESIKKAAENGMFLIAECGGFLYLHEQLEGTDGKCYPMAGVIPAKAYRTPRLSRFGYIELSGGGERIKAHEFHYWDSTAPGDAMRAEKPLSSRSWNCIHRTDTMVAGFPHLYYPSNPAVAEGWLKCMMENAAGRSGQEN